MRHFSRITQHQQMTPPEGKTITVSLGLLHEDIQKKIFEAFPATDTVQIMESNGYHDFIYVWNGEGFDRFDTWYY